MTRMTLVSTCLAALLGLAPAVEAQGLPPVAPAPAAEPAPPAPGTAPAVPTLQAAPEVDGAPPQPAPDAGAAAPQGQAAPGMAPAEAPATPAPGSVPVTPAQATAPEAPAPRAAVPPTASQPLPSPQDLSPLGMYRQADRVVKSVMLVLLAACFLTWTVWLFKTVETFFARRRARRSAQVLTRAGSLAEAARTLSSRRDPAAFLAHAVLEEYGRSDAVIGPSGPEGVKERAASLVARVEAQAAARLRRGMGLLATVGAVAPFVGLFGTVWGIMNAFIGIAETQTTNLAVVAPGIAEALFATAIGLVAAIPAVVIYNHFTRGIAAYRQSLGDAGAAVLRLLSRDIDFRQVKGV